MANPDDDLDARVRTLQDGMVRLQDGIAASRTDAAAAHVLAGGADREVSEVRAELRAHTQVLNALRETQLAQDSKIEALRSEMRSEVDGLRAEMQRGFGMLHTGIAQIAALLRGR